MLRALARRPVHRELGTSLTSGQDVTTILAQRLPVTAELLLYAFVISVGFAVAVALLAARKPNGVADRVSMVISMAGLSPRRTCSPSC